MTACFSRSICLCSTPFGIGDRCGWYRPKAVFVKIGAQRLSASEIGAALDLSKGYQWIEVLNAFRHRRSVRKLCSISGVLPTSAQRLSASEIGAALSLWLLFDIREGAQRLSASEIGAGPGHQLPGRPHDVLNAFRHRRSVRSQVWLAQGSASSSAQRLSASEIGAE
ncbi:uncharacterized protein Dmul_04120 [Desulfococcus multivorans]|nr:uncharacterized protein Dmul_04120 [Desulfococcus multivorans]